MPGTRVMTMVTTATAIITMKMILTTRLSFCRKRIMGLRGLSQADCRLCKYRSVGKLRVRGYELCIPLKPKYGLNGAPRLRVGARKAIPQRLKPSLFECIDVRPDARCGEVGRTLQSEPTPFLTHWVRQEWGWCERAAYSLSPAAVVVRVAVHVGAGISVDVRVWIRSVAVWIGRVARRRRGIPCRSVAIGSLRRIATTLRGGGTGLQLVRFLVGDRLHG